MYSTSAAGMVSTSPCLMRTSTRSSARRPSASGRVVDRPARSGAEHAEMLLALLARRLEALTTGGEKDEDEERLAAGAPASRLSAVLERVSDRKSTR